MRSVGVIFQALALTLAVAASAHLRAEDMAVSVAAAVDGSAAAFPVPLDDVDEDIPTIRFGRAVDLLGRDIDPGGGPVGSTDAFSAGMPLSRLRLTSGFGERWHPVLGARRFHAGVDLSATAGTPVYAASRGRVETAGYAGNYGIMVAIAHGGARSTRYAHLSAVSVRAGEEVTQGQVIGYVGSTGRSTGAHLHFELRVAGRPVDPLLYWRGG